MTAKELKENDRILEKQNQSLIEENKELQELIEKLRNDLKVCQTSLSESKNDDLVRLETELETVKKEQEDLLVLLTDQDSKIRHYKNRLKELGQTVSFVCNSPILALFIRTREPRPLLCRAFLIAFCKS